MHQDGGTGDTGRKLAAHSNLSGIVLHSQCSSTAHVVYESADIPTFIRPLLSINHTNTETLGCCINTAVTMGHRYGSCLRKAGVR